MLEMTIESQAAKISAGNILFSFVKISNSIYLAKKTILRLAECK